MSITILLEIGHDASLRSKTTPEGFTHDWEVFVKGFNGADIHYYVEKVVFHLHETFPKPKRVVKEPPYSLRTSGYAGFNLPVEIYLRNNQDPKKIKFNYELQLQPSGPPVHRVQKEKYTFFNPSEEFKSKLLKGGAVVGSGSNFLDNSDSSKIEEKNQMTSKPKMSGMDVATKKHRIRPEESRNTTDFENLFGPPIKKTSRVPEQPKPKEVPKSSTSTEKSSEKDKLEKSKTKSLHKDKDKEKPKEKPENLDKRKEDKKKSKDDKSKERDKSKDKGSKKDKEKERDKSPSHRPKSPSPKSSCKSPKRASSPITALKHGTSNKEKEQSKEEKKDKDKEKDRSKDEKKSKKDKREHKDSKHRDKDREKDHKEHKSRESKTSKERESTNHKAKDVSPVSAPPVAPPSLVSSHKSDKKAKEKDHSKEPVPTKEEEKPEKPREEPADERQKHRHKKKDRKERREDKHSRSEKKPEKQLAAVAKEVAKEPQVPVSSSRDADKSNLFGSPRSDSPPTPKEAEIKAELANAHSRDDDSSNESCKISSREASPIPKVLSPASLPPSPVITEPVKKPEPERKKDESLKKKERKEKKKDKKSDKDHDRKRKRKSDQTKIEVEQPPEKIVKVNNNSDDESKVSSTEDANTVVMMQPKSECDMDMLRELQQKIMSLKDNADLQKVVQLIAETGQYEVSAHTFDFDLCLLDKSTVRQLQEFFSTIS